MNDAGDKCVLGRAPRETPQFDIAEAVVSQTGLIHLFARTPGEVPVCRQGATQVCGVDSAIVVKHFCIAHGDRLAWTSFDPQLAPSDHVLSKIEYPNAGDRFRDGNCSDLA